MKLLRLKSIDHRIFKKYSWPEELRPFGRYNVIYGWNGCGKTTLSGLLAHLQDLQNITEGKVQFEFDQGLVEGMFVSQTNLPPVRVFNRDFQHSNLLETRNEFSPIYVIGQEDTARQKDIDSAKADIEQLKAELGRLEATETNAATTLRKFYEKKAKSIKESLQGGGSHRYSSYDRSKLENDLKSLTLRTAQEKKRDAQQKKALHAEKDAKPADALAPLVSPVQSNSIQVDRVRNLLDTEVVAQTLEELSRNPLLSRWVQDGLELHRSSENCGFCGGRIEGERLNELTAHFNESLKRLQNDLKQERDAVHALIQSVRTWSPPDETRLYEDLRTEYLLAKSIFENAKNKWLATVATFDRRIVQRIEAIFECSDLEEHLGAELATQATGIVDAVQQMNGAITRHNERTENFADAVAAARDKLAWSLVAENFDEHIELQTDVEISSKAASEARERLSTLSMKVTRLEREMREHRRAAVDLNADLHSYLGRNDLEFVPEENGYSVRRHGERAYHLSEGEKTAITFLYFLKTLEDQSFDMVNGIVVVDDPVSSLDANALFSAFAYMKNRTEKSAQLFILTHNYSFFRQVKNWFQHINKHSKGTPKKEKPQARFYQLSGEWDSSLSPPIRKATLDRLDPMLRKFESEYHYLFKIVHRAHRDGLTDFQQAFPLPNLSRRLLESFLAFRYPNKTGNNTLYSSISEVVFDEGKKNRLHRFLNAHSHQGYIDDGGGEPWSLGEIQEVLKDLFLLIQSEDRTHFNGMVEAMAMEDAA